MSKVDARLISGLDDVIAKLFAPSISEGQQITCYAGEEMTPYTIQGDNIPTASVQAG